MQAVIQLQAKSTETVLKKTLAKAAHDCKRNLLWAKLGNYQEAGDISLVSKTIK